MKILVRATNWVGDAIMSLPALHAIRNRWPDASISILARPWVADLYREQNCANQIIVYDNAARHLGFWGRERLAHELRGGNFDVAILLQNAFDAAWIAWRAGIPERIGYARDGRSFLLTNAVTVPKSGEVNVHESYYYLELLRRARLLDKLPEVDAITLAVSDFAQAAAEQKLEEAGSRHGAMRIAIAPGAAYGSAKCWLPERYAAVADALAGEGNCDLIIFGTSAERETAEMIVRSMRRHAINLAGTTSVGELPAMLRACHLFIGNDSGAMHVAAAVGVPVIGIFGSTNPDATSPVTPKFTLVREPVDCSPCLLRTCPIDHRCMTRISAERVLDAAHTQLSQTATTSAVEDVRLG